MNGKRGPVWVALALAASGCSAGVSDDGDDVSVAQLALSGAQPQLIAIGTLDASGRDLSGETADPLENGAPGNLLGGLGSGLAYAGGQRFLALPDRGPNATAYNAAVDETTSYIPRFHSLRLRLTKDGADGALPMKLQVELKRTTLLFDKAGLVYGRGEGLGVPPGAPKLNKKNKNYFSGRSDNFDAARPSTDPRNGRLDPEGVRVSNDGSCVFVSDEYGPYVYEFERSTGKRRRTFTLPNEFAIATLSPQGAVEISSNTRGRVANKGMEGLAITPDGGTLIGAMQSPLAQDKGTDGRFVRLVAFSIDTGATEQFAYELSNIGTAAKPKYPTVSEIVAIGQHEFLVDERDGKGLGDDSAAAYKRIYRIDLRDAVDVSGVSGEANLAGKAVPKTLFLDVVAALVAHGVAAIDIPAKLEGLAFGPEVRVGRTHLRSLVLASDNDFLPTITDSGHPDGVANPNRFYVFGVDPASLSEFEPQRVSDDGEERDE